MKISIITTTFNSDKTLQDTFDSIQSQEYKDIEIIVIDGGSNDGTLERIKENSFVSNYVSEPDEGIYDALNKGVNLANGVIIGFLHSDDIFNNSDVISTIASKFSDTTVDGVYGDLLYVNKNDTTKIVRNWKSCNFKVSLLKRGWMPAHPTLFLRKEVYKKHGMFDLSYSIASDYDFMLRILTDTKLKFCYIPKVITKMRVGGASNRSLKNMIKKTKEDYRAATTNNIGGIFTVLLKNTSKLKQFLN